MAVGKRFGKALAIGSMAIGLFVGSVVYAFSQGGLEDRCPPDRDLFTFGLTSDGTAYETPGDAAAVVAMDHGYADLSPAEREKIDGAAQSADASSMGGEVIVLDPKLPDTADVVKLVIAVERTDTGEYVPSAGSYCARVVNG